MVWVGRFLVATALISASAKVSPALRIKQQNNRKISVMLQFMATASYSPTVAAGLLTPHGRLASRPGGSLFISHALAVEDPFGQAVVVMAHVGIV